MIHNEECGPFVRGISIDPKPSYHNLHNAHVAFWAALGIYGVTFRMCRTGGLLELAIQVIKKNDGILSEAVYSELQAFTRWGSSDQKSVSSTQPAPLLRSSAL